MPLKPTDMNPRNLASRGAVGVPMTSDDQTVLVVTSDDALREFTPSRDPLEPFGGIAG